MYFLADFPPATSSLTGGGGSPADHHSHQGQGHREDEPRVVVGVLADQVDPGGGITGNVVN